MKIKRIFTSVLAVILMVTSGIVPKHLSSFQNEFKAKAAAIVKNGTCGENITWELSDDGVLTISGTGKMNDYSETADSPFSEIRKDTKSLVIKDGITTIGKNAFFLFYGVKKVIVPKSVTYIGQDAFRECFGLRSITIENSKCEIYDDKHTISFNEVGGGAAFGGGYDNGGIVIHGYENSTAQKYADKYVYRFAPIGEYIFYEKIDKDNDGIYDYACVSYCDRTVEDIEIPLLFENLPVVSIDDCAFMDCTFLNKIKLPDSITLIWQYAFSNCSSLTDITLPNGITSIKQNTFSRCSSLKSIEIPDSVETIEQSAFYECSNLESVVLGKGLKKIGMWAFDDCSSLTKINMPDSITFVGMSAFRNTALLSNQSGPIYYVDGWIINCDDTSYLEIKYETKGIADRAIFCPSLESIKILNPKCNICDSNYSICNGEGKAGGVFNGTIYGYKNSTAQKYAEKYNRKFIALDGDPIVTTKATTTAQATTTTQITTTKPITTTTTTTKKNEPTKYIWGVDNWNFDNSSKYFSSYDINNDVFKKLTNKYNYSEIEKQELKNEIKYDNFNGWGGSCAGITISQILVKNKSLKLSDFGGNDVVNKNRADSNMISLINFYQETQLSDTKVSQSIRSGQFSNVYYTYTQKEYIKKLISEIEALKDGSSLIYVGYRLTAYNYSQGDYENAGGHAVLAYGIEDCKYKSKTTGKTYTKRILIADPNKMEVNGVSSDSCIYYDPDDYSWIIEYWNGNVYNGKYRRNCYWNASSGTNVDNGYISKIYTYDQKGEMVDLMTPNMITNHYLPGINVNNIDNDSAYSVSEVKNSGNSNMDYAGDGDSIIRYGIERDDMTSKDCGDSFAMWNPTSTYELSYNEPSCFNTYMDYENIAYDISAENTSYIQFKPNGNIQLKGSDMNYNISIVTNKSKCITDWYNMEINGKDANNVNYKIGDDGIGTKGYIINSDNLKNVFISANNDSVRATARFSTEYTNAFIYEIDKMTIGVKVDSDNNGTYETSIDVNNNKIEDRGDINNDGKITVADVVVLQKFLVNMPVSAASDLDVSGDGINDIFDDILLKRFILKK